MAGSTASTVAQFLAELPPERRAVVSRVRDVVRAHMPAGYEESMGWGMICWSIPLSRYPDTYNKQPLGYVCLAAQKHYYALHLTTLYMDPERGAEFARAFAATGRKLDMGKGCVRFRSVEALPLDVVAETIARTTPEEYIAMYERARASRPAAKKPATKKAAAKKAAATPKRATARRK
jgi:uncharacterized protein YdhG (YjbR/CyaY superfamily)